MSRDPYPHLTALSKQARELRRSSRANVPLRVKLLPGAKDVGIPLAHCQSGRDGECSHASCPQLRPGNYKTYCPLAKRDDALAEEM